MDTTVFSLGGGHLPEEEQFVGSLKGKKWLPRIKVHNIK